MIPHIPHKPLGAFAGQCLACKRQLLEDDAKTAEFCSRRECQTRRNMQQRATLAAAAQKEKGDWLSQTHARTHDVIRAAQTALNAAHPEKIASGIAPYIEVPVVPLPPHRKTEFVAHLRSVVEARFVAAPGDEPPPDPPETDPTYAQRIADEAPEHQILDTACIACQGDCCMQGNTTKAFLTEKTINYVRWSQPDLDADAIMELYLSHLPDMSVRDSCVYHGETGCTLNRTIRADICNSFQCSFRKTLAKAYAETPGHGAVVAGISKDHVEHPEAGSDFLRVVSMSEDGEVTVHSDLTLPALGDGHTSG